MACEEGGRKGSGRLGGRWQEYRMKGGSKKGQRKGKESPVPSIPCLPSPLRDGRLTKLYYSLKTFVGCQSKRLLLPPPPLLLVHHYPNQVQVPLSRSAPQILLYFQAFLPLSNPLTCVVSPFHFPSSVPCAPVLSLLTLFHLFFFSAPPPSTFLFCLR